MLLVKYYDSELEDENEEENIIFQVRFSSTCHDLNKISMINISNMFFIYSCLLVESISIDEIYVFVCYIGNQHVFDYMIAHEAHSSS